MNKSSKGTAVLTACQIQATRLNNLEYRRLQQNVNIMHGDLKIHLTRLQRQAQNIKYHYSNVVQTVKPNPRYQLWKEIHAYEIAQDENKNWIESKKFTQKLKTKIHERAPSSNEVPPEPSLPLLLLVGNDIEKSVESMITFNKSFPRPNTSPVKTHIPNSHRKNALLTMLNEHSINANNSLPSKQSKRDVVLFQPLMTPAGSRKFEHRKSTPNTTQKTSDLDTLYRIALQNQTAYKSVQQTHIDKRKLLDKQFATQHRALKGTIRSAGRAN